MASSKIAAAIAAALLACASPALATVVINGQGSALAPVSVAASAVKVIPCNTNRDNWVLYSETVDLRCTVGTINLQSGVCTAPTAPTASTGFYIAHAQYINEKQLLAGVYQSGPNATLVQDQPKVEIDCILATGSTPTGVDTWEENYR